MPGNELGDRVHNFFAEDNSTQGQHQSHVLEGNWPVLNNNYWAGSQRQIDVLNSSSRNYPVQNSVVDGGQASYPVHAPHGLNLSPSTLIPDTSKTQYINEQQYSTGAVHGNHFNQNRKNETNFLAVDTGSGQRHLLSLRGLSFPETQQQSDHEQEKASDRLGTSTAPVSLDLFGGQSQMNHPQASMLQALKHEQSGLSDMQQVQQQIMIRKMQEFQMQQHLKQLDLKPQHLVSQYQWTTEPGTSWLNGSSSMQGSPGGLVFPQNIAQAQRLMDLVPQQADQSLYGVPVSSSVGLAGNQYPQMVPSRPSMPQMEAFSNSLHGSQHNPLSDRIGLLESTPISEPKFQIENIGHGSNLSLSTRITDGGLQQHVNSMPRNDPQQQFAGRQERHAQSDTSHERSTQQISSSPIEAALDPTEEKILYGSDDNIWAAFGKSSNMSGDTTCHLFDNGEVSNGFPSIQSGSWSALMQSAVAEISNSDVGQQEEWIGLNFRSNDGSSVNQSALMHNNFVRKTSLPEDEVRIPSTRNFGSVSSSEDINTGNALESSQFVHKFSQVPGIRVSNDVSNKFKQSLNESGKWSTQNTLQKLVAKGSQIYENVSQHSLGAERTTENVSANQTGTALELNGGNAQAAVPPGGDRMKSHQASQKLQSNQSIVMQDIRGNSLWKSNSPSSAIDFGPIKVGSHVGDKGILSLNNASASVTNSCNVGVDDGNCLFVTNNNLVNHWKNADPVAKFQGTHRLGSNHGLNSSNSSNKDEVRRVEMENFAVKENSSDSHRSNLSQHASGGPREAGISDACDSGSLLSEKQKLTNKLDNKVSVSRKFHYNPMGNLDDDLESTFGLKQPMQLPSSCLQNTHLGQTSLVTRYSAITDEGEHRKDNKGGSNEPTRGSFPRSSSRTPFPFNWALDSYTLNKDSSPSQNMLDLLDKVDQSRNDGADGTAEHIQRASVSKGFGLQLGSSSEHVHAPDLSLPSQNVWDMDNSMHTSHAGVEMIDKMLQPSSVQSLPFPYEGSPNEIHRSSGPGNLGDKNSLLKAPGNGQLALGSPCAKSQLQIKHMRESGKMAMVEQINSSSFSSNTSHSLQRGSAETILPDAACSIQKHNLASYDGITDGSDVQESGPVATASTRDQALSSLHFGMPGNSQHVLQNNWNNIPSSRHLLTSQYPDAPSHLSATQHPNIVESNPRDDLHDGKVDHLSSGLSSVQANTQSVVDEEEHRLKEHAGQVANMDSISKVEESIGKISPFKNNLEEPPVNSASTQKGIEAFGQSLNQMSVIEDSQTEPSIKVSKRMKVPDNIFYVHQFHPEAGQKNEDSVRYMMSSNTGVPFRFSSSSDMMQRNPAPHGNIASHDFAVAGVGASQNNSSSDCTTSVKAENHQVAPQMTPFWFNQYEHLKNGKMFPVYTAHNDFSLRPNEPSSTVVKSSSVMGARSLEENSPAASVGACQIGSPPKFASTLVTNEHLSSAQSLQLTVMGEHPETLRPQKRKTCTSELNSWQKEISDVSQKFLVLSATEGDWSKATNRFTEKVQDDAEVNENGSSLRMPKRRLILTTQLMQQLFRPPTASVLSADASSTLESVIYGVSRAALGDACSAVSCSSGFALRDCPDLHSMKSKLNGDPCSAKVFEELLAKAGKLEDDFLRLNNSSILDLRVECQELEKFSVINRFARFHGRSQNDNAEVASVAATATTPNPHMQRYVLALPLPMPMLGNLPDTIQCLLL